MHGSMGAKHSPPFIRLCNYLTGIVIVIKGLYLFLPGGRNSGTFGYPSIHLPVASKRSGYLGGSLYHALLSMNKRHLAPLGAALLGVLASFAALAQSPDPADTARMHRHEFGLTASPRLAHFFTANRTLPIGLFYKRQLTPNKSLRLRLVGLYSYADSANSNDAPNGGIVNAYVTGPSYRRWQVQAFAGYAWQRPLGRRVLLNYGLELGLGYQRQGYSSAYRLPYSPGGFSTTYDERTTQDWQVQARPFAGLSYYPAPRLCVFVETALPLSYTYQLGERHARDTFTKSGEVDRFLNERTQAHRVTLNWQPVQMLGATYAF